MNIFYLDSDPRICASYHTDRHVVKMILESAQLLCTALNVVAGEQVAPYKSTHVNHPCSVWVRESYSNWSYVWQLMRELEYEWNIRYEHFKSHKAISTLIDAVINGLTIEQYAELLLPNKGFTTPALAMPEHCIVTGNAVESYRKYYREEKQHLHKWTNRERPWWL